MCAVTQPEGQLKVVGKPLCTATHTPLPGQYLYLNVLIKAKCTEQLVRIETRN